MSSPDALKILLAHASEFRGYALRKLRDPAAAEELVQEAFARAVERISDVRESEAVVGWFYRVLDNAIADQHRRRRTRDQALDELKRDSDESAPPLVDSAKATCRCVQRLARELKPEYAEALQQVAIEERSVSEYAEEAGISRNNAAVRSFRARAALKERVLKTCGACAAAGCVDCGCSAE